MSTERSEFYNSYLGQSKNKFSFSNHKKTNSIGESELFSWTSNNMYRTSYHDMSKKVGILYINCYLKYILFLLFRANQLSAKIWWFQDIKVMYLT